MRRDHSKKFGNRHRPGWPMLSETHRVMFFDGAESENKDWSAQCGKNGCPLEFGHRGDCAPAPEPPQSLGEAVREVLED